MSARRAKPDLMMMMLMVVVVVVVMVDIPIRPHCNAECSLLFVSQIRSLEWSQTNKESQAW